MPHAGVSVSETGVLGSPNCVLACFVSENRCFRSLKRVLGSNFCVLDIPKSVLDLFLGLKSRFESCLESKISVLDFETSVLNCFEPVLGASLLSNSAFAADY